MKTHVDRQVKERPVLFNAEMVKAILDGRKTMTRRIMKLQLPERFLDVYFCETRKVWIIEGDNPTNFDGEVQMNEWNWEFNCPFGIPGDRLWVRETWCPQVGVFGNETDRLPFWRATNGDDLPSGHKWRPSIHMPRWASRITLEVTAVRVERVQDISEEDAKAEGAGRTRWFQTEEMSDAEATNLGAKGKVWNKSWDEPCYRNGFANLWESTYSNWQQNPWVWCIEFKRL